MQVRYVQDGDQHIVYDADRADPVGARHFDPGWWRYQGALSGQAGGRGTVYFVRHGGSEWALRHYRRGGLVGRMVSDRYAWLGLARTRPWREWHLLAELHRRGLPVPAPVAARAIHRGAHYLADLITVAVPDTTPLSGLLQRQVLPAGDWGALGRILRRFHDAGVLHADLNAHNVLYRAGAQFFVIDFDRGRLASSERVLQRPLQRLHHSLLKCQRLYPEFHFNDGDWQALLAAYRAPPG